MIDEVDMHLHPSWQKRIIQDLTRIFPNVQFIVTTNAPSVLVNVYKENIRLIKNNTVDVPQNYSYGRNITAVIHELMETEIRPQDILNKLKEFNNVLDEGNVSKAKEIVTEIEKQLGSNDQDVVDAKIAIALESV
ncbi:AAA family ATPase [Selenomonas ruminantium]|uniref:AAA family ATPase n=1 Tax=Selenomonas ruminantium TaxID=971 RepID=UPI00047C1CA1|nr:AAA family ATPase [Selenomonas ruminantium]